MEKIESVENMTSEEREAIFKSRAQEYISKLNLPPFEPGDLKLARSEKEIEKCKSLIEKEKHKAALRARDLENKKESIAHRKMLKSKGKQNNFKSKKGFDRTTKSSGFNKNKKFNSGKKRD